MFITPLQITAYTLTNALGRGQEASFSALVERRGGLVPVDHPELDFPTWVGAVDGLDEVRLSGELAAYDCRNNRLALLGLEQDGMREAVLAARGHHGAGRIGVFLGTSTSGIRETEKAYAHRDPASGELPADFHYRETQNLFSVTAFVRRLLGLEGPAVTISTACSSSAKVFAVAYRALQAGWCDAALVGGVDSLCLTTLYGFHALGLVSANPCAPWDRRRGGISLGEAVGYALLERVGSDTARGLALLGYGESADAYHISTPHPDGAGAALAMRRALASARMAPEEVDWVNLHGTGTRLNDQSEDRAMAALFPAGVTASGTKGWTGHTLGAAGITEAVISLLALERGLLPGTLQLREPDPELTLAVLRDNRVAAPRRVTSNSFGFGGSNCSLIFGKLP